MLRPGDEPVRGYRLEAFLGKGQYGEVWRARSPGGAKAALKFLDLGGRAGWKEFRAVQRVKEIRHANLMPITALWVFDKDGNLIDDAVVDSILATDANERGSNRSSQTLRNTLRADAVNQPLPRQLVVASLLGDRNMLELLEQYQQQGNSGIPVDELLAYMEQAAKGIDFLNTAQHDLGQGPVAIQHCDIKPENIMLVGDSVLVCDFGLASVLTDAQAAATATGMVGSLAYMSPECVSRKPSCASDQYSLAISYIELRTGELPFAEKTFASVLDSIRNSKLDLTHVTAAEADVLRRATASNPADRFPTAAAMVVALKRAHSSDAIQVVASAKNRLLPLLAALGIGGFAVWLGLLLLPGRSNHLLPTEPIEYTISVDPNNASLATADGSRIPPKSPGIFQIPFDESKPLELVATCPPNYRETKVTVEKNANHTGHIELRPTPSFLKELAFNKAASNDWNEAVEMLARALQEDDGPDHSISQVPSRIVFGTADSDKIITSAVVSPEAEFLVIVTTGNEDTAGSELVVWDLRLGKLQPNAKPIAKHSIAGKVPSEVCLALNTDTAIVSYYLDEQKTYEVAVIRNYFASSSTVPRPPLDIQCSTPIPVAIAGKSASTAVAAVLESTTENESSHLEIIRWDANQVTHSRRSGVQPGEISSIAIDPLGKQAIAMGIDDSAYRWRLNTGDSTAPELIGSKTGSTVLSLPQKDKFAIGVEHSNGQYRVELHRWDGSGENPPTPLNPPFEDAIMSLATDQEEKWLAAGSADGNIKVWSLEDSDSPPITLPKQTSLVDRLAMAAADGSRLNLLSMTTKIDFWNLHAKRTDIPIPLETNGTVLLSTITINGFVVAVQKDGRLLAWDGMACALLRDALERNLERATPPVP